MIGALAALTVLWIALFNRIWSLRRNRGFPKVAYTVGLGFVVISFTLRAADGWFDHVTGTPNLGDLAWHVALVFAGAASLLYIQAAPRPVRPRISAVVGPAIVLAGLMIVLWIVSAPIHTEHMADLVGLYIQAGTPGVVAVVAFELFLIAWTAAIAAFSWKSIRDVQNRTRILALHLTAGGACLAALGAAVTTLRVLWKTTSPGFQDQLFQINAWCSYSAAIVVGAGVSIPTISRYLRAMRDLRRLLPLRDQVHAHADNAARTRFGIGGHLSPHRALVAIRTDLRDAFVQLHIERGVERDIAAAPDRAYAVGVALNDDAGWSVRSHSGRSVRYVLPHVVDEQQDLDQLLRIAEGLRDTQTGAVTAA